MNDIQVVEILKLSENNRGKTYEFNILREQGKFIYIKRSQNSLSGNTYHTGKSKNTNPKIFVLLDGEIELNFRRVNTVEKKQLFINQPSIITVYPYVIHNIRAITNISMLECNSISDIENDRFKEFV